MFEILPTGNIDAEGDWEFVVKLERRYSVHEFIDAVLSRRKEFGIINVDYILQYNYDFRQNKLNIQPEIGNKGVKSVRGFGYSWMRKDYYITT